MKNRITLIGNVGGDPEVITFDNGNKLAKCSLATSETWKDKVTGEKIQETQWHKLVVYEPLCRVFESYVRKGSKISVDGTLKYRSYEDKEGGSRTVSEIHVKELILLDRKEESNLPQQNETGQAEDDLPF